MQALESLTDDGFIINNVIATEEVQAKLGKRKALHCKASVVKEHLGKTIIQYDVEFEDAPATSWIGILRNDRSWRAQEHAFSMLELLTASGFDQTSCYRVPRPLFFRRSPAFLLMEKAEGRLLVELFEEARRGKGANSERLDASIRGSALWLAKLHNAGLRTSKIHSLGDTLTATLKFKEGLIRTFPVISSRIDASSEEMMSMQRKLIDDRERKLIHGDYNPTNIFSASGRITVIDFPESSMGDPAFDLGYFSAQLKMTFGFGPEIRRATRSFLDEYTEHSPPDSGLEARVRIYEAQTYFQRLYHAYCLLGVMPDYQVAMRWVEESMSSLERAT